VNREPRKIVFLSEFPENFVLLHFQNHSFMPESQIIEYKSSWRDEYLRWICGFANANGGTLYIGKNDSGAVVGVKDSKKLMEDLPNKITAILGIVCDVNLHLCARHC
jgi:predicted HTH transcriptional regulator